MDHLLPEVKISRNNPLLEACCGQWDDLAAARFAIVEGYPINERSPLSGRSPLHEACARCHALIVSLLLDRGADIWKTTRLGEESPLHLSAMSGSRPITLQLLNRGCDHSQRDRFGNVPLHNVRDPAVAKLLIRHGANVSLKNKLGKTPLDNVRDYYPENRALIKLFEDCFEDHEMTILLQQLQPLVAKEDKIRAAAAEKVRQENEKKRNKLMGTGTLQGMVTSIQKKAVVRDRQK